MFLFSSTYFLAISYELFTAVVIFLSKYFSNAKENKNNENIVIKSDGIKVKSEKKIIYFLLAIEPRTLILFFNEFFVIDPYLKIFLTP